ncbi:serpin family protein [Nitrosopumilus sp.]|uniref:serpin family protein n=1 Tax=Nitrosopumilus sp. TaxID=2024843 RepID=UPI00349FDE63
MKYSVLFLIGFTLSSFLISDIYADSVPNDDYLKFDLDDFYIYADNRHITDIILDWNGETLPYGTISFDDTVNTDINIMIPKNIPRKTNLDFGSSMAVFYSDTLIVSIKETETDCFIHLRIPVNNADKINIDSISVAAGRLQSVTVNDPKCESIYKNYSDTYKSKLIPSQLDVSVKIPEPEQDISVYETCGAGTILQNDICVVDESQKQITDSSGKWGASSYNHMLEPPLKQFKSGHLADDIQCKDDFFLIQKYDGSPACVTPKSAQNLYERGWTLTLHIAVNRGAPTIYLGPTDIPSANNQFAFRFYSQVSQDKEHNVFFSPTSIFTAFAIAYEGARDHTAGEIRDVFGFEVDDAKRRAGFASMQKQLNIKEQNNTLSLSNALWIAENFEVLPQYVDTAKTYYGSEIESVDFSSKEKSLDIINQWADTKTRGKIKKIFDALDPNTKLAITNAIYFKGNWSEPFDKEKTVMSDFHVTPKVTVQVPMMESKTTFYNIAINDLVQILELPYYGDRLSMIILLPKDPTGMTSLEGDLSADNLNKWKEEMHKKKIKLYMPKFKLETTYDLKYLLQEMGIHDAFDDADFGGISNSGLYIDKAVHKAIVDINEEGTESAAVTGILVAESGPLEFTLDRQFIFLIQDNETGSILFIGKVVDPLQ